MGNCASRVGAENAEGLRPEGPCKSHLQFAPAVVVNSWQAHENHHHQQQEQKQDLPTVDVDQLHDEVLCEVLSLLPLHHLVQLSCCSRRLHQLVCRSGKCLTTVDLQQVPPRLLSSALNFLAHHPAAGHAIHTAVLPGNMAAVTDSLAAALAAMSGLQQLHLYRAHLRTQQLHCSAGTRQPSSSKLIAGSLFCLRRHSSKSRQQQQYSCQAQPDISSLNLQQLSGLTRLDLSLQPDDTTAGKTLDLPPSLNTLNLTADSFPAAINPLDVRQLGQLSILNIEVSNSSTTGSSDSLIKLLELPNLQHLGLGGFGRVPQVLHSFSGLASLRVEVRGRVVHQRGASHQSVMAASAPAKVAVTGSGSGLLALPARPNLQLQVHMSVPPPADSLSEDWSCLANLRHLALANINPIGSKGFDLNPLSELGRLRTLSLGFKGQQKVAGQGQVVELHGLPQIIHLKALSVTSSGPGLHLTLEPPRHLTSLIVACQARLTLAVPGSTAAAAAQRAAAAVAAAAAAARVGCDYISYDCHLRNDCSYWDSPHSQPYPGGNSGSGFDHSSSYNTGYVTFPLPTPHNNQQPQPQPQPKAQGLLSGGLASAYCPTSHSSSTTTVTAVAYAAPADGYDTAAMYDQQQQQQLMGLLLNGAGGGVDAAALLMMQRRLDRLGSIGECEEAYNTEDEAEQLSHLAGLGLMAGGGISIRDHLLITTTTSSSSKGGLEVAAAAAASGGGSRSGSFVRVFSTSKNSLKQGVWPFDDWLAAKGLDLQDLHLVELTLTPTAAAAAAGPRSKRCSSSSTARLLARRGREADFMADLCHWGFM